MLTIKVYGIPGPQGSKKFCGVSKSGRGIMVESSAKVKPWREAVKWAAREAMAGLRISVLSDEEMKAVPLGRFRKRCTCSSGVAK